MYKTGDLIVYRSTKHSTHPTPRAVSIDPAPNGEFYTYEVVKYWVVSDVLNNGALEATTRRGKTRVIQEADPALRHAYWWERLFLSYRFPSTTRPMNDARMPAAG
jgi:hypothetical protein